MFLQHFTISSAICVILCKACAMQRGAACGGRAVAAAAHAAAQVLTSVQAPVSRLHDPCLHEVVCPAHHSRPQALRRAAGAMGPPRALQALCAVLAAICGSAPSAAHAQVSSRRGAEGVWAGLPVCPSSFPRHVPRTYHRHPCIPRRPCPLAGRPTYRACWARPPPPPPPPYRMPPLSSSPTPMACSSPPRPPPTPRRLEEWSSTKEPKSGSPRSTSMQCRLPTWPPSPPSTRSPRWPYVRPASLPLPLPASALPPGSEDALLPGLRGRCFPS